MAMEAALDPTSLSNVTRPELFTKFKDKEGLFLKAFFASNFFNANPWTVTSSSLKAGMKTGLEKRFPDKQGNQKVNVAPIILMPNRGHPPDHIPDMLGAQEEFRVGNFMEVGIDNKTGNAFL